MTFSVQPGVTSGLRVFGWPIGGGADLLVDGDCVVNGAWVVRWLTPARQSGVCRDHPGCVFHYKCHVSDVGSADYNEIQAAAEVFLASIRPGTEPITPP